jgi:hypothetical protein
MRNLTMLLLPCILLPLGALAETPTAMEKWDRIAVESKHCYLPRAGECQASCRL